MVLEKGKKTQYDNIIKDTGESLKNKMIDWQTKQGMCKSCEGLLKNQY